MRRPVGEHVSPEVTAVGLGTLSALVDRAREGDEDAFAALVRHHQDRAYRIALRLTGRPPDAEDVVQEAFLHAWRGLPRFRQDAEFGTWLTRIVINRCHNLRRAARPADPLPDHDPALSTPGADSLVVEANRRNAALAAIADLPFDQRAPLVLQSFGGCTYAEVGRILGITENTAKVRVHRARTSLRARLQDWR